MGTATDATPLPDRRKALWFWIRVRLLTLQRSLRNVIDRHHRRWKVTPAKQSPLSHAPILAEFSSPLWHDGHDQEFILAAGKVHNLRLAAARLHGVDVPAGATWSFWAQVGRLSRRKGYVIGREVREGCMVPTIGGGVCQISNAAATAAVRSGMRLVERHGHTSTSEAAAPQENGTVDATLFWNHIDLRIQAAFDWRMEVELGHDHLTLRIRGRTHANPPHQVRAVRQLPIALHAGRGDVAAQTLARGCLTCDETRCFRHQPQLAGLATSIAQEAWLLASCTPEFRQWLHARALPAPPLLLTPFPITRAQQRTHPGHMLHPLATAPASQHQLQDRLLALRRGLWARFNANSQGKRQASLLAGQRWLAARLQQRLGPQHVHLVVDQALLPWLWQQGALAGRSYRVLAGTLPMHDISARLDAAATRWPGTSSLVDFRIDPVIADAELTALQAAEEVLTPHTDVARVLRQRFPSLQITRLPWHLPPTTLARETTGSLPPVLVFPASALPRKGWMELCQAFRQLQLRSALPQLRLRVLGSLPTSVPDLPPSVVLERGSYAGNWHHACIAVVLPAHVEHAPRMALQALSLRIPVVATAVCGLADDPLLTIVNAGDVEELTTALAALLRNEST